MSEMPRKLHIGPGKAYLPGFWNVDIFSNVKADDYADCTNLPYPHDYFDLIYVCHVAEHIHRHQVVATLNHWKNLLRPGGTLRLSVPNFAAIASHYMEHGDVEVLMGLLYGGQNFHLNRHTVTFDDKYLTKLLEKAGMVNVRWWDWRTTEADDYASAFLPHRDESGRLMSLNLEADRPQ